MGYMYGFTVQNWKARLAGFPIEDAFDFDEKKGRACVTDGVTRDFTDRTAVTHDLKGLAKVLAGKYSRYAQDVSKIAVNTFMTYESLDFTNRAIWSYNFNAGLVPTNYLDKDLAGCTFASVTLESDPQSDPVEIDVRYIADAGVAVVDKDGKLMDKSNDEGPHSPDKNPYLEKILSEHGGWLSADGRRTIRRQYRNKPYEPLAYGVLTGEESALSYVKEMTLWANHGDYVLLFTDGIGELLFPEFDKSRGIEIRREYADKILNDDIDDLKKLCQKNVHGEGTLVTWKVG